MQKRTVLGLVLMGVICNALAACEDERPELPDLTERRDLADASDLADVSDMTSTPLASLQLVVQVTNDNGGTAQPGDFGLTATGPTTLNGTGMVTSAADFKLGTYTLSSSTLTGYTSGAWSCSGAILGADNTIMISLGDVVTCSTTYDDVAPSLTLSNQVFNDNAGTHVAADFTLTATGPTPLSGPSGVMSDAAFQQGTYTLGVTGPSGYSGSWSCAGGSLAGNMLTIALGEDVACAVVEDDDLVPLVEPSNTAVTSNAAVQQQPSVAVDDQDSNHVAIAYMDYSLRSNGYAGIGVAMSTDGGSSWTRTEVPAPAGFDGAAGFPVAKFYQGKLYVAFMAATFLGNLPGLIYDTRTFSGTQGRAFGMQANNGIFVARSDDGGTTWGTADAVASNVYSGTNVPFEAMPDLAIDASSGNFYVTWTRFYPAGQYPGIPTSTGGSAIMLAASTDGGQTWTTRLSSGASVIQDAFVGSPGTGSQGTGFYLNSRVTVGPESDVYVSASAAGHIAVFHSTNAGVSFTTPSVDPASPSYRPFGLDVVPATGFSTQAFNPRGTLFNDSFRTLPMRAIAADPTRAGYVYFVEAVQTYDTNGNIFDAGSINFARSTDYGVTWTQVFTLGGQAPQLGELDPSNQSLFRSPLNDEDGNRFLAFNMSLPNEVISGQALPELSVDAAGNIVVLWYDTRRDAADQNLDVFATISTDGGQSFTANNRVTRLSFDPSAGAFTDARGGTSYSLGDRLGLGVAGGKVYAAWTDTQSGDQEIAMNRSALSPPPVAPNDRYEPNETPAEAIDLGTITGSRIVPRLVMVGGENDWFALKAGVTGTLTVAATAATGGDVLEVDLWDGTGTTMLVAGQAITDGQQLSFDATSGQQLVLRIRKQASGASVSYALTVND